MRLRQLPQIYLRGAIANETMKHMSSNDQKVINTITEDVVKSPILAGHRHRFVEKLSQTIGGDYNYKSKAAADQEFYIAVWRAVVYLFHHTDYSYCCDACGNMEYQTQRGKSKAMDRRYPVCPECETVKIDNPGTSIYRRGDCVKLPDLQKYLRGYDGTPPSHVSPISPIKGTKKIPNHDEIMNDSQQMAKFFGEFIWNYFRQTLRENEIKFHQKDPRLVAGPADMMATEEVRSLLTQLKIPHRYEKNANPQDGSYRIIVDIMATNQSVSRALRLLVDKYKEYDITISASDTEIMIEAKNNVPCIEVEVITPQEVCMQGRSSGEDGDDDNISIIDIYSKNIAAEVGGDKMQEDGIAMVESEDLLSTIRNSLKDGAQKVFDIKLGRGDTYDEFLDFQRGDDGDGAVIEPHASHIARFMNVSQRQVTGWLHDIEMQCLAYGIGEA